ncbi:MAG: amino acid ABC transporter permease [Gammaproteobacteria bacterium]|nr:amino acid ABC transporter permease [Gammaproteobacteria bacterium]
MAVVASLLVAVTWIAGNTAANLESRGIASGFGFLSSESGFGIIQSLIAYDESSSYGRAFVVALLNTLVVSAIGILLATGVGFVIGIARLSSNWLVARLAGGYVEVFRNIPLLLQLFFWYFAVLRNLPSPRQSISVMDSVFLNIRGLYLPRPVAGEGIGWVWLALLIAMASAGVWWRLARRHQDATGERRAVFWPCLAMLAGLPALVLVLGGAPLHFEFAELRGFNFVGGIVLIPELAALVLALSAYTAAFVAEIVRAGILSVDRGQTEAARALGLRRGLSLRLVIIPQAMRVIIPPLTSQYLNLVKNSSLAAAIAYPELVSVFAGTVLNQTGQAIEVIALTMGVYLVLSLSISALMNWYNQHSMLRGRG